MKKYRNKYHNKLENRSGPLYYIELKKHYKVCPVCNKDSLLPTLGGKNIECSECNFTTDVY